MAIVRAKFANNYTFYMFLLETFKRTLVENGFSDEFIKIVEAIIL